MKKVLLLCLLTAIFVVGGCSSSEPKSTLTLDKFIKAYTDAGVTVDPKEKPIAASVGAKDGIIFYMGTSPVKIYEYESVKKMQDAFKDFPETKEFPNKDRFLLVTQKDEAKEIFNNVK